MPDEEECRYGDECPDTNKNDGNCRAA